MILVCHGVVPYEQSERVDLYRAYAAGARVVYVEPDPAPWRGTFAETEGGAGEVSRVTLPGVIPRSRILSVARLNRWLTIRRLIAQLRAEDDVVFMCQRPELLPTLRGLGATLTVYEVVDDYRALTFDARAARFVERAHRRTLREADLVWVTSDVLADSVRPHRPDVVVETNGVSYDVFARAAAPHPGLDALPRPRVGLVGRLNDRIDWDLLNDLCRQRPDWSFVVVGPVYCASEPTDVGLRRLAECANVHRVGGVPEEELPDVIAGLDVCLIPYQLNAATRGINPLKVYQYLAAGKPVVATPLPALRTLAGSVALCPDAASFADAIAERLPTADDPSACAERRGVARRFDWSEVAERRRRRLERTLSGAPSPTLRLPRSPNPDPTPARERVPARSMAGGTEGPR